MIAFQEVDRLADLRAALEPLGYTCGSGKGGGEPLIDCAGFLSACRGSRVAFAEKAAAWTLANHITAAAGGEEQLNLACVKMMGRSLSTCKDGLRSLLCDPDFMARGGVSELIAATPSGASSPTPEAARLGNFGVAVFWQRDRLECTDIRYLGFGREGDDGNGAVRVTLTERSSSVKQPLHIMTTHLASGLDQEAKRVEQFVGPALADDGQAHRGVLGWFAECEGPAILAMDANSRPQFDSNEATVWRTAKAAAGISSCWDEYFDANGNPTRLPSPVSVNKLRGPGTKQAKKIGVHAFELIDHMFFKGGLKMRGHALEPQTFTSREDAASSLIPSLVCPSDHYPVVVDYEWPYL